MLPPWPLLWLLDPAGAYLARRSPRTSGPVFRRGAVFGPDVPGGSRQATDEEIAAMEPASRSRRQADEAAHDPVPSAEQRAAAERLVHGGVASLGDHSVEVRVLRFWRGDSVLEIAGPGRHGTSHTRVPRRPDADLLAGYLAVELADG